MHFPPAWYISLVVPVVVWAVWCIYNEALRRDVNRNVVRTRAANPGIELHTYSWAQWNSDVLRRMFNKPTKYGVVTRITEETGRPGEDFDHEYVRKARRWVHYVMTRETYERWVMPIRWIFPLQELVSVEFLHEHTWVPRGWANYTVHEITANDAVVGGGKAQLLWCPDCNRGRTQNIVLNDEPFDLAAHESKEFRIDIDMPDNTSNHYIQSQPRTDE